MQKKSEKDLQNADKTGLQYIYCKFATHLCYMNNGENENMVRVGIIGATGYAGGELVRLLLGHKDVEIKWYGSRSYVDQAYASVYQNMFQLVDAKSGR